jgi:hypothetical protein
MSKPAIEVSLKVKDLALESLEISLEALKEMPGYTEKLFKDALYVG